MDGDTLAVVAPCLEKGEDCAACSLGKSVARNMSRERLRKYVRKLYEDCEFDMNKTEWSAMGSTRLITERDGKYLRKTEMSSSICGTDSRSATWTERRPTC